MWLGGQLLTPVEGIVAGPLQRFKVIDFVLNHLIDFIQKCFLHFCMELNGRFKSLM